MLEGLNKPTQDAAITAIAELRDSKILFYVTSGLRTEAEQAALFAQGRERLDIVNSKRIAAGMRTITLVENGYTVTNCDGVKAKSNHQSGDALDVVPAMNGRPTWPPASDQRWFRIAEVMKKHGFEWGGDWKQFPDLPHYQRRK